MSRVPFIALFALLLLLPATAAGGKSSVHLRGTVASKAPAAHRLSVRAPRQAVTLRVPGSQSKIETGERVELRGTTLREQGGAAPVLARGVTILSSKPVTAAQGPTASDDDDADDDGGAKADDDDDKSGPGSVHDDDDDDDSGSGSVDDDDNDDHGGPGSGDDDGEDDD